MANAYWQVVCQGNWERGAVGENGQDIEGTTHMLDPD